MEGMTAPPSAPNSTPAPQTSAPQQSPNQGGVNRSIPETNDRGETETVKKESSLTHLKTAQPPKEQTQAPKVYDVKVNNKIVKMTEEQLLINAAKSQAATERFNEAAKMRQQHEKFQQNVKKNAIQALMDPELGLTKEQIKEQFENWYNDEFIVREQMSPDQRRFQEQERRLAEYEEREQGRLQQEEQDRTEKLKAEQVTFYEKQIIETIEKSGLPRNEETAKKIAFYMGQNMRNGWDAPIEAVIEQVREDYKSWGNQFGESATAEQLIDVLGESNAKKINQYFLKQYRDRRLGQTQDFGPKPTESDQNDPESSGQKLDSHDVKTRLNRLMREGW